MFFLKNNSYLIRVLLLFICLNVLNDVLMVSLALKHINNHFAANFFTIFETCFLFFFLRMFTRNKLFKKVLLILPAAFLLFSISRINNGLLNFIDPALYVVSSLLLLISAAYSMLILSSDPDFYWNVSEFWILCSILFFYSASVTAYAFSKILISDHTGNSGNIYFIAIFSFANILTNIGFAKAFTCKQTLTK